MQTLKFCFEKGKFTQSSCNLFVSSKKKKKSVNDTQFNIICDTGQILRPDYALDVPNLKFIFISISVIVINCSKDATNPNI